MQRDEASWSNGWWMARFCGPLNAMLRNLAFMVFTKTMEVCKQKKKKKGHDAICALERQLTECLRKDSQFAAGHLKWECEKEVYTSNPDWDDISTEGMGETLKTNYWFSWNPRII